MDFLGVKGVGLASMRLVFFDVKTQSLILKCSRSSVFDVISALSFVCEFKGRGLSVVSLYTSGTIRSLREKTGINIPEKEKNKK